MILVIAEQRDGTLNRASWEPIVAAQQAGQPVKVAVLGQGIAASAGELAAADVAEVIVVEAAALAAYTADAYTMAIEALIKAEQPSHVFFSHTYQARDLVPKLAARLDRALIADVVAMKPHDGAWPSRGPCSRRSSTPTSSPRADASPRLVPGRCLQGRPGEAGRWRANPVDCRGGRRGGHPAEA